VLYRATIAFRNRKFDAGKGVVTFDRPVISVGNISVGGTGKTPMVEHLIQVLRVAGRTPCIAMRGYKSPTGRGDDSDEARAYRERFADLPIVAQPRRVEGLIELFSTPDGERIDTIVLDDGFQHRRIARQVDIVLIDATRSPFDDRLLPAGWLREPVASLSRAHAVVITHAEAVPSSAVESLERRIRETAPHAVRAVCEHAWQGVALHESSGARAVGVESLRGKRLFLACAIGNPEPFVGAARRAAGRDLAGVLTLRDHDPYSDATIDRLIAMMHEARAEMLVATSKDWAKLSRVRSERWPCPVGVPELALRFRSGGNEVASLALSAAVPPDEEPRPVETPDDAPEP